jgi:glycosyltransferase involved in cell wall biosynthesis
LIFTTVADNGTIFHLKKNVQSTHSGQTNAQYSAPIVSIIIPAKNEAENIKECLLSLSCIDYPSNQIEIIVVDNGSKDNTVGVAQSYKASIYVKPKLSISALRNFGAQVAKGQILAFLDADCTVPRDWLLQASRYFPPKNIVCFGSAPRIPDNPTWVQKTWYFVRKKRESVLEVSWLESMNMFIRREAFEEAGGFNETLITCEDVDISYRLARLGKIISDQRICAIHHGEARDIKSFFRKELWRGKSNYKGLVQHGLRIHELPSLVLPIYYLLMLLATFFLCFSGQGLYALAAICLQQFPLAAITFIKVRKHSNISTFLHLLFLYNIYFCARGIAIF